MLRLDGVSRRYIGAERAALDSVSWQLRPGVTGLVGSNGAGKSTLMRILTGSDAPSEGTVEWAGLDLASASGRTALHRELGYLPQEFTVDRGARCGDVLAYIAWLKEIPRADSAGEVDRVLGAVGLADRRRTRVSSLSGGMRQRLGVAQALLGRPTVLVLDEPTAGLDPRQRRIVRDLLVQEARWASVLVSTHLIEEVAALGGQVALLDEGRLRFTGSVAELAGRGGGTADSVGALEQGIWAVLDETEVDG